MTKLEKLRGKYTVSEVITKIDIKYGLGALERTLACNWFNPFATLYLNLRSFPFSQALSFPVYVYGRPRIYGLSGRMTVIGKVYPGMISFNKAKSTAPSNKSVASEIRNDGTIVFRGKSEIGAGTRIATEFGGLIDIGADTKITDMCNVEAFTKIEIGDKSWIVHRCQVLDANYHYVADYNKKIIPKYCHPIKIGVGCWICNSTTITGRCVIPNYAIVGSNSLVNKDFSSIEEGAIIAGIPAKVIATGFRRVLNLEVARKVSEHYRQNPDQIYVMDETDTPEYLAEI